MGKIKDSAKQGGEKIGGFFSEFKEFALKGNVMSMAVGVLIGGAFNELVKSFTDNIITPVINMVGKFDGSSAANLAITFRGQTIQFGAFIGAIINFAIMAFVVFLLVKGMNALMDIGKKKEVADPTTKKCPFCCSEIAIKATRCPNCTSELTEEMTKAMK